MRWTNFAMPLRMSEYIQHSLKDRDTELQYYRRCVELAPSYPYAQHNLGICLNRKKCWAEAEAHLRYAVEHNADKRLSCRNLFKTLEQLGKTRDLCELVQQYPEYFQTKYYQERFAKIAQAIKEVVRIDG